MHVRDLMTATPITIGPLESLQDAMEIMHRRRVRHLPVVDGAKLVGLLTDRDLRRAAPSPLVPYENPGALMEQTTVERVMVKEPQTVSPNQPIREALQLFVDKKYGALPVLEDGRLIGIVTPIDVMRHLLKKQG